MDPIDKAFTIQLIQQQKRKAGDLYWYYVSEAEVEEETLKHKLNDS